MPRRNRRAHAPAPEALEARVALSVLGVAGGIVTRPREVSTTAVEVAPRNLTPGRASTVLTSTAAPSLGSPLEPAIVGVSDATGASVPTRPGMPYRPGLRVYPVRHGERKLLGRKDAAPINGPKDDPRCASPILRI